MKQTTKNWITLAEDDLLAAKKLAGDDRLTNLVSFHCQQCMETASSPSLQHNFGRRRWAVGSRKETYSQHPTASKSWIVRKAESGRHSTLFARIRQILYHTKNVLLWNKKWISMFFHWWRSPMMDSYLLDKTKDKSIKTKDNTIIVLLSDFQPPNPPNGGL